MKTISTIAFIILLAATFPSPSQASEDNESATLDYSNCSSHSDHNGCEALSDSIESLSQRLFHLEKKQDYCNIFINTSGAFRAGEDPDGWYGNFYVKNLRLEIKGNITDHLYYRLRHRLNRSGEAATFDNLSRATDYAMLGYRFNPHWALQVGKMCQFWGGFEFDANPIYIHQFSDMFDNIDSPHTGLAVIYDVNPQQEFVINITNSLTNKFTKEFAGAELQGFKSTRMPLTAIFNWNGKFADNRFLTRWSVGARHIAEDTWGIMGVMGQELYLPNLQTYLDFSVEKSDIDRMGVASRDMTQLLPQDWSFFRDATYWSLVWKLDWQFKPQWNLFSKAMLEWIHLPSIPYSGQQLGAPPVNGYAYTGGTARHHVSYLAGAEYYPVKGQDLRVYLAYIGNTYRYAKAIPRNNFSDNRIELGIIYRLKIF